MKGAVDRDPSDEAALKVPPEIAAEASVWIARLHGPDRSPLMERECLAWQARSAVHRLAFERCTDVWEAVPSVRLSDAYATASSVGSTSGGSVKGWPARRSPWASVLMVAALIGGGGLFAYFWRGSDDVYATKVGEQLLVVLDDGTRLSLNTETRVRVTIDQARRSVNVEGGEALFEVAKDPTRPFVVRAAGSEVIALGTVFAVRLAPVSSKTDSALTVTLIEGKVSFRPAAGETTPGIAPSNAMLMQAGERIQLSKSDGKSNARSIPQVDRPLLDQVLAWRRSEAVFDNVSLPDAVLEMNRYNRTPIVLVGSSALSNLRVSGLYKTGDSVGFAHAVASLHGLAVREHQGRLELATPQ